MLKTFTCAKCGELSMLSTAYRMVIGWEEWTRSGGGTHALSDRKPLEEFACNICIDRLVKAQKRKHQHNPTGVICSLCDERPAVLGIDYRKVIGWEKYDRNGAGGTNQVRVREPLDEFACRVCVKRVVKGISPRQGTLI